MTRSHPFARFGAKRAAKSTALREVPAPARSEVPPTALREDFAVRSPAPFALRGLFAVVAAIAAFAYAISAWGVYGFAAHVWQLPTLLCFGAAIVADLLSLAGAFATYLLRDAPFKVRGYAWAVFFVMTGLSLAANESYASWRAKPVPPMEAVASFDARAAAGAIVVALALAVHLLIVAVRHTQTIARPAAAAPPAARRPHAAETPAARPTPPAAGPRDVAPPSSAPKPRRAAPRAASAPPGSEALRRESIARVEAGERPAAVAASIGKSTRTVEIWMKDHRAATAQAPPDDQIRPINGVPVPALVRT